MIPYDPIVSGVRQGAALRYQERNPEGGNPFRASGIGGCQRALALKATPSVKPLPRSARSALTLDHGTLRGKELAEAFQKAAGKGELKGYHVLGTELTLRVPVPCPPAHADPQDPLTWPEPIARALKAKLPTLEVTVVAYQRDDRDDTQARVYIVGHTDIAIRDPRGRISVGDFKTAHSFTFKGLKAKGLDPTYLAQLGIYHLGLARMCDQVRRAEITVSEAWGAEADPLPDEIELGDPWLLYESKDDHQMLRIEVPAEQAIEAAQRALARTADTLLGLALASPPPARPYRPNPAGELPWQCRYCDVYETCWKGQIVSVKGDLDDAVPKAIIVQTTPYEEASA